MSKGKPWRDKKKYKSKKDTFPKPKKKYNRKRDFKKEEESIP